MLLRLSIGVLVSTIAIAPLPAKAEGGSAEDLDDVMSISIKDVVKPTLGFQGALHGMEHRSKHAPWLLAPLCWRQQRLVLEWMVCWVGVEGSSVLYLV